MAICRVVVTSPDPVPCVPSSSSPASPRRSSSPPPPTPTAGPRRELACLAEAVYFEARGTGAEGETAVAHVVLNRSNDPKFPDTVCGVVADGCQFSYRCDGRPDALADPKARARAFRVAEAVLAADDDPTNGALFFHSPGQARLVRQAQARRHDRRQRLLPLKPRHAADRRR